MGRLEKISIIDADKPQRNIATVLLRHAKSSYVQADAAIFHTACGEGALESSFLHHE